MLQRKLILMAVMIAVLIPALSWPGEAREVLAGDIIEAVNAGRPVFYDGVSVAGPLDLSGTTVNSSFVLTNSILEDADFSAAAFMGFASLEGSRFRGLAEFSGARFTDAASFADASFDGGAHFNMTAFDGHTIFTNTSFKGASFVEAIFVEDSSFAGANFHGIADFNYTEFQGFITFDGAAFDDAYFSEVQFSGVADLSASFKGAACFQMAHFVDYAGFSDAEFGGPAFFGGVRFDGVSSFGPAHFRGPANFILAEFGKASSFTDAVFDGDLLMGLSKFEGLAYLGNCTFRGNLLLKSARIYEIKMENATFGEGSEVFLEDADFQRFKVPWAALDGRLDYDGAAYLSLVRSYRDLEWFEDADRCYYAYRLQSQMGKPIGWSKAIDVLAWTSCGYGVRPSYALAWAVIFILAFAGVFLRWRGIYAPDGSGGHEPPTFRDALYFSSLVFLSQAPGTFIVNGSHRYVVILEGLLGWLVLALFLVTLGNVMIR